MSVALARHDFGSEIQHIESHVTGHLKQSEPLFLNAGRSLEKIAHEFDAVATKSREMATMAAEQMSKLGLTQLAASQEVILVELQTEHQRIHENLATIELIATRLRELHDASLAFPKLAKRLDVIRICFAVESARSQQAHSSFGSFIGDLNKLGSLVASTGASLQLEQSSLEEEQGRATEKILSELDDLESGVNSVKIARTNTHEVAQRSLDHCTESMQRFSERCERVGAITYKVIMALQFHDIVRQQIEHALEGLRDARESLHDAPESLARAHKSLELHACQISDAVQTIRKAAAEIREDFRQAQHEVGQLDSHLEGNQGTGDTFRLLLTQTDEILRIHQRVLELHGETVQITTNISTGCEGLNHHVGSIRHINSEMQLRALNAAIKSARLGELGATLRVLSGEVANQAHASHQYAENTVAKLNAISETASALLANQTEDTGADQSTALKSLAQQVQSLINNMGGECGSIQLAQTDIQDQLKQAVQSTDHIDRFADSLAAELDSLQCLINTMKQQCGPEDSANPEDHRSASTRYTMHRERVVHLFASEDDLSQDNAVEAGGCVLF